MTLTTDREEFEKWFELTCGLPWGFLAKRREPSGRYMEIPHEDAWQVWQASRELLDNREAQPVAYTEQCEISNMQATGLYLRGFPDNSQGRNIPLYTVPPAPAVPDGWKLVPIDATRAMIDAAQMVEEDGYDAMHKAMLAAAPEGGNG